MPGSKVAHVQGGVLILRERLRSPEVRAKTQAVFIRPALVSLLSTASIMLIASVTSASFVSRPKLNLIEESTSKSDKPMALKTWEGSGVPVEHAEPVDAASLG